MSASGTDGHAGVSPRRRGGKTDVDLTVRYARYWAKPDIVLYPC